MRVIHGYNLDWSSDFVSSWHRMIISLSNIFVTDRVRSTTRRLRFDTCLSVCPHQRGVPQPGPGGGVPQPDPVRGTPCWGTPMGGGVPHLGYLHQTWLGGTPRGYPTSVSPIRSGWGVPWWGYPTLGTPHVGSGQGVPQWGVPHLRYPPIRPGQGVPG